MQVQKKITGHLTRITTRDTVIITYDLQQAYAERVGGAQAFPGHRPDEDAYTEVSVDAVEAFIDVWKELKPLGYVCVHEAGCYRPDHYPHDSLQVSVYVRRDA